VDGVSQITPSSRPGRGWFLLLPCDWRFLPKLGLVALDGNEPSLFLTPAARACHALPFEKPVIISEKLRQSFVRRSNQLRRQQTALENR
jgi:hypothetical protein